MLFRVNWMYSKVDNRDGFWMSVENFTAFTRIPCGVLTQVSLYYTIAPDGEIVLDSGNAYFKCRSEIDGVINRRFRTLDEFYDFVGMHAAPDSYGAEINLREVNPAIFTNCGEVGLTAEILRALFTNIEIRLNETVFGVCEATPLLK